MKKLCKWMLVICCCVFALGALAASAADTVYVKDGGKGDGSSASSPLGDLADAIRAVSGGGKVVLTGGTTITGCQVLEEMGFRAAAINAVQAATNKSREL